MIFKCCVKNENKSPILGTVAVKFIYIYIRNLLSIKA